MRDDPALSVIVPTYNEALTLPRLLEGLREHVRMPYEVVVVDDASPDGTASIARDLSREHPVRVLEREGKLGLGSAIRKGVDAARADVVIVMDADLSHSPADLPRLIETVFEGADLAVGSRYVAGGEIVGWGAYRRLVSGVGNGLAKHVLAIPLDDTTTGYRVYGPEAKRILLDTRSEGYAFQIEVLYLAKKAGLTIAEAPIRFENRREGKSKLGVGEFVRFLGTVGRLRFTRTPPPSARGRRVRAP